MLEDVVIPLVAIISAVALPITLGLYTVIRIFSEKHQENMELIKQGIVPVDAHRKSTPNSLRSLRNGMLCIGVALGLIVSFFVVDTANFIPAVLVTGGLILFFLGLAYVGYYFVSKDKLEAIE